MGEEESFATPFLGRVVGTVWKSALLPLILRRDGHFSRRVADLLDRQTPAIDAGGVLARDHTIDEHGHLSVRIFTPHSTSSKLPVIFFFHGGFFAFFTAASSQFDSFCRSLSAECPAVVVSVSYRRIPEHRYPAAIQDGLQTLKYFQSSAVIDILPATADRSNAFLVGDSAGGNLVHNLWVAAQREDLSPIVVRGLVLIQPSFGGKSLTRSETSYADVPFANQRFSEWRWKAYLPDGATRDHPACNPFGGEVPLDLEAMKMPPTLVAIGGACPGQDRHADYVAKMKAAGKDVDSVLYPGACHGFYLIPKFPASAKLCKDVATFIRNRVI